MTTDDPTGEGFDLATWEADRAKERDARRRGQGARDIAWREDGRTRRREKGGPSLAPSYVSVPVPDPAPREPVCAMVQQNAIGGRDAG